MSNKERIVEKYIQLASKKPLGIELENIDPVELFNETQNAISLKDKLNRFGQIFKGLEGLKQFVTPYYNSNKDKLYSFRDAIFYNEMVQIQVFFEFIKDLKVDSSKSPLLYLIIENKNNQRLNKIRNSIAHFDWKLKGDKIEFKDNNYSREENYYDISEFCSLISLIAIFMTNDINQIE